MSVFHHSEFPVHFNALHMEKHCCQYDRSIQQHGVMRSMGWDKSPKQSWFNIKWSPFQVVNRLLNWHFVKKVEKQKALHILGMNIEDIKLCYVTEDYHGRRMGTELWQDFEETEQNNEKTYLTQSLHLRSLTSGRRFFFFSLFKYDKKVFVLTLPNQPSQSPARPESFWASIAVCVYVCGVTCSHAGICVHM